MQIQTDSRATSSESEHNVWDRKLGESGQAYAAFRAFRDLGLGRRLSQVAQQLSKSKQLMQRWSMRWSWHTRAIAWDHHVEQMEEREMLRQRAEFRKLSLSTATNLAMKASLGVQALKTVSVGADGKEQLAIRVTDLIRILELGYKMQGELLGKNEEDHVAQINVIFGNTEDDELEGEYGGETTSQPIRVHK